MFEPLPERLSYPAEEHKILEFWKNNDVFEKTLENRKDAKSYAFYEGPPTVNGNPGVHHVMARTIKDTICRYKTMTGHLVRRQAGWDTHGLPVEIAMEKQLGFSDKSDIEKYGVAQFNAKCKAFVYENIEKDHGWGYLTERMGYWVNLEDAYITCTNNYIESVWWALKEFWSKGLIYKGFKVVPQSPTIQTPLSSHELSLGYKDVRDPSVFLKLKVLSSPIDAIKNASIMVWTTTPWTLFANVACAVGKDIEYVHVRNTRPIKGQDPLVDELVLAKARLSVLEGEVEVLGEYTGEQLLGTEYEQILKYCVIDRTENPNALTLVAGDFVSTEDGSGIVHLAPAFGEDDYRMSKVFNLPFLQPVTPNGHLTEELGEFAGRAIKNFTYEDGRSEEGADKDIIIKLKYDNKIYRATNDYLHSYPHCWRTGNPIMYYARDSWFIRSPEYKEMMVNLNKTQIKWQPPEIGEGRFGNWLEDVKEWSLSRDRYWGTPLPLWVNTEDKNDFFAVGSIEELSKGQYEREDGTLVDIKDSGVEIDLHRPFVDHIVFTIDGKTYRRTHEVIDVWFDSGSMFFAQMHYPFENQELFNQSFPGDFIAEGIDQTRGWFYTLHNIASAIFGKPAFKNIIVNELILDAKGIKMSKSKGNTVDPFEMFELYGADAVRWYLLVNNPPWKSTKFDAKVLEKTVISDFLRSLTNTYAFFALYANIDDYNGEESIIPISDRPEIDRWIISKVNSMIKEYVRYMEDYDITKANRAIQNFAINELSNWYIRRNRRRFWKGEKDAEKIAAYQTLHEVLLIMLQLISPTAPFISETLYLRLKKDSMPLSVHLCDLPTADESLIFPDLERKMNAAQIITSLARSLREKANLRVRQPLRRILVPVNSTEQRRDIQSVEDIIKEEINIKAIEYVTEETDIVRRSAKPNFKIIGKKYGNLTKFVAEEIRKMKPEQIKEIEVKGTINFMNDGSPVAIITEDIEIINEDIEGWLVATERDITVAIDTELDETLINEGIAREFVNRIQNLRKDSGFEVTDRIIIEFKTDDEITNAIIKMTEYVKNETLAEDLISKAELSGSEMDLDGKVLTASIRKI